jgi:hypothetical protein
VTTKTKVVSLDALRDTLADGPEDKAWRRAVALLDKAKAKEIAPWIKDALPLFEGRPALAERRLPLGWIERLASGKKLPQARLASSLDLGNGLALEPGNFNDFCMLEEEQLEALEAASLDHMEYLSYSDDVGEHPMHPGFLVDADMGPATLAGRSWEQVHTLRLNGWGLSSYCGGLIESLGSFPALRRLEIDRGDSQETIETETLETLLASPALEHLAQLSLRGYFDFDEDHARLLAGSPHIARLKKLRLGAIEEGPRRILADLAGVEIDTEG